MNALLPLVVPALGAVLVVVLRAHARAVAGVAVLALVVTIGAGAWVATTEPTFAWQWSRLIELRLAVEGFGRVMIVLVPLVATPIVAYAAVTEDEGRVRLLGLMLAFVAAMLLLVSASDFVTLLVAWELVGALSWALIGHGWRDPDNPRAAAAAFLTTRLGDLGLYLAAGTTFAASGSFAFAAVGGTDGTARGIIAAGVLLAAAAKSAQVPFSPWLFAAMAGPTPVSALLHSATLVAAGAFLLIRLSPVLEPVGWFLPAVAVVGLVTALAGGIVATVQTHAKRALAASTSAQYGLMFAAVGAGFPAAAAAQLVAHAAFKSLLFLGAGVAIHAGGTGRLGGLRLGRALPRIALLSWIGALALAAVPPLGAAWSKEQILAGAADASAWFGAAVLAAGFLSALYAARYQLLAYGRAEGPGADGPQGLHAPGRVATGSMAVLATVTVGLSLLWLPGAAALVEEVAGPLPPAGPPGETAAALLLVAVAFWLAFLLRRRSHLLTLGLAPAAQDAAGDWLGLPAATGALVVRPSLRLSRLLRLLDERVVDAGVRRTAALGETVSRLFSRRLERMIDGAVGLVARGWLSTAAASRIADDAGVDATVEAIGQGVGLAGHQSRRLQTGLSHEYFVVMAVGLAAVVAILATAR